MDSKQSTVQQVNGVGLSALFWMPRNSTKEEHNRERTKNLSKNTHSTTQCFKPLQSALWALQVLLCFFYVAWACVHSCPLSLDCFKMFTIECLAHAMLPSGGMHMLKRDLPLPLPSVLIFGQGRRTNEFAFVLYPVLFLLFFSLASTCLSHSGPNN